MARIIIETNSETRNDLKSEAAKRGLTLKDFMLNAAAEKIRKENLNKVV